MVPGRGDVQTTQLSALAITTAWTIGVIVGLLVPGYSPDRWSLNGGAAKQLVGIQAAVFPEPGTLLTPETSMN